MHDAVFVEGEGVYERLNSLYRSMSETDGAAMRIAYQLEKLAKRAMYRCEDCGDCSLADISYLCPRSQCAKTMRNGPCGGSFDGMCEVDDRQCIWARAYDRAKYSGQSQTMLDGKAIVYDPTLNHTSGIANKYLNKSHDKGNEPKLVPNPLPNRGR